MSKERKLGKKAQRKADAEAKRKAAIEAQQQQQQSEAQQQDTSHGTDSGPNYDEVAAKATREAGNANLAATAAREAAAKISATNLGRIAHDLKLAQSDIEKHTIMVIAARRYQTTTPELSTVVDPYLNKVSESGKLDTRRLMLDKVQSAAFQNCIVDNALIALDHAQVAKLAKDKLVKLVNVAADAKRDLVELLHSHEGTTSQTQGYCAFIHSPSKNLFTEQEIPDKEFYLVSQGWDGKRNFPYYGVRMTPSDNPKNTREIHCTRPDPTAMLSILLPKPEPEKDSK